MGNRHVGNPRSRKNDNIKIYLKEKGGKCCVCRFDTSGSGWDIVEGSNGNGRSDSTERKEIMD